MEKLLQFRKMSEEVRPPTNQQGKFIYDLYRRARLDQGWAEFEWEKLSRPQQLVWARVTERLASLDGGTIEGVRLGPPPHNLCSTCGADVNYGQPCCCIPTYDGR